MLLPAVDDVNGIWQSNPIGKLEAHWTAATAT